MKKLCLYIITFITTFVLTGCSTHPDYFHSQVDQNLLKETWLQEINTNPNVWTRHAGKWFFTGEPDQLVLYANQVPVSRIMTNILVRVPNFNKILVSGNFQVQIVGRQEHNSVSIIGPNAAARQVAVDFKNNTLFVHQSKDCKADTGCVIVRIGVRTVNCITAYGNASITGRDITTNNLSVNANGSGNILLGGDIILTEVNQTQNGTVTILRAFSPTLRIKNTGNGTINVNGRVGVQSISNTLNGEVHIIGADTDSLTINAAYKSITTVVGYANLRSVIANGDSQVYVYWVNSNGLYVKAADRARVGLAGCVSAMNIELSGDARFEGQYLHSGIAYAKTFLYSHANIAANQRMYATAMGNSSIYFFGPPESISRFNSENGTIIPIQTNGIATPMMPYKEPQIYTPNNSVYTPVRNDEIMFK